MLNLLYFKTLISNGIFSHLIRLQPEKIAFNVLVYILLNRKCIILYFVNKLKASMRHLIYPLKFSNLFNFRKKYDSQSLIIKQRQFSSRCWFYKNHSKFVRSRLMRFSGVPHNNIEFPGKPWPTFRRLKFLNFNIMI